MWTQTSPRPCLFNTCELSLRGETLGNIISRLLHGYIMRLPAALLSRTCSTSACAFLVLEASFLFTSAYCTLSSHSVISVWPTVLVQVDPGAVLRVRSAYITGPSCSCCKTNTDTVSVCRYEVCYNMLRHSSLKIAVVQCNLYNYYTWVWLVDTVHVYSFSLFGTCIVIMKQLENCNFLLVNNMFLSSVCQYICTTNPCYYEQYHNHRAEQHHGGYDWHILQTCIP